MTVIARHVLVAGRVQGVGFRWHTRETARRLGLSGWVENLPDGRVEAWIEGEAAQVEEGLAWLAHGPRAAHVTGCEARAVEPAGCAGFELRRA